MEKKKPSTHYKESPPLVPVLLDPDFDCLGESDDLPAELIHPSSIVSTAPAAADIVQH